MGLLPRAGCLGRGASDGLPRRCSDAGSRMPGRLLDRTAWSLPQYTRPWSPLDLLKLPQRVQLHSTIAIDSYCREELRGSGQTMQEARQAGRSASSAIQTRVIRCCPLRRKQNMPRAESIYPGMRKKELPSGDLSAPPILASNQRKGARRRLTLCSQWRPRSESNRRTRLCRPLHDHSATWPLLGASRP